VVLAYDRGMPEPSLKNTILSLDRAAPRYTSYPPATQFRDSVTADDQVRALQQMPDGSEISLYLHIPFCAKLCYYCGCFTTVTRKAERIEAYLEALKQEAQLVRRLLPQHLSVTHLHFGGGSPTMLTAPQFEGLCRRLRQDFSIAPQAEIAIEVDPRQLNEAKVAAYALAGVNRISLGVQDFNDQTLQSVNRRQPFSLSWAAVHWCRDYGIERINLDLMYGLPYQTVQTLRETLRLAIALNPSRIAFFGYAHVPWMKKHMKAMDMAAMPDASLRYDLYMVGREALLAAGYQQIGIDHFVRPDDPMAQAFAQRTLHRNFQGYTTDTAHHLIGLGASAISDTPAGYAQNINDIARYQELVQADRLPIHRGVPRAPLDDLCAQIIEQLMCYHEVDLAPIVSRHGQGDDVVATALARLEPLITKGVLEREGLRLRVPEEAALVTRLVASAFDHYTPWEASASACVQEAPRHARAV